MADTADDGVDISGMPPPPDADANVDISSMPTPTELFKRHVGRDPEGAQEVQNFMTHPEGFGMGDSTPSTLAGGIAGAGEEFMKAGSGMLASIPAAFAYGGAAIGKAFGKDVDPAQVQRDWQEYLTYKPHSEAAKAAEQRMAETYGPAWRSIAKKADQAAKAVGKVSPTAETFLREAPAAAQAAGGIVPALGGAKALWDALPEGPSTSEAATMGTPPGAAPAAPTAPTPPVEGHVTGADLRAQPDPLAEPPAAAAAPGAQPAQATTSPEASAAPGAPPAAKPHIRMKASAVPSNPAPAEMTLDVDPNNPTPDTIQPNAAQRKLTGGVRFTPPTAEGASTGELAAEHQASRTSTLHDLNELAGGQLGEVRTSAVTGDTAETGTDWAHAKVQDAGGKRMQEVIGNETNALRAAADNLVERTGTVAEGADQPAMRQRGTIISSAISKIEKWFDDNVKSMYETAKSRARGIPIQSMQNLSTLAGDESQFAGTMEGEALYRGVQARARKLGLIGDDGAFKPATIEQAEQMRQALGEMWTPRTHAIIGKLKDALDMDVARHGGADLFEKARALRSQKGKMLEDPTGIAKLLHPDDRLGINREVPLHEVPDYVANLDPDQFNHVINVLKSSAHLGSGELAEDAAAAIREIKGHMAAKLHEAGSSKIQGGWDAKSFYKQLNNYSLKMPSVFSAKEMGHWKTVNDASNVLRMDRTYKGAKVEEHNIGLGNSLRARAGTAARLGVDTAAHHVAPVMGPALAESTGLSEKIGKWVGGNPEKIAEAKRLAHVEGRITKLEKPTGGEPPMGERIGGGKQRGGPKFENNGSAPGAVGANSIEAANRAAQEKAAGQHRYQIDPDGNVEPLTGVDAVDRRAPQGHITVQRGVGMQPYSVLDRGGLPAQHANGLLARAQGLGKLKDAEMRTASQSGKSEVRPTSQSEPLGGRIFGGKQRGAVGNLNRAARKVEPLEGAPAGDNPNQKARAAALTYAKAAGIKAEPLSEYRYIPKETADRVAQAYDQMQHAPNDPKVKAAYDAFKQETKAQWDSIQKTGLKVDFKQPYPYGANPREVTEDVRNNNHMTVFPTEEGFGTDVAADARHPMLEKSGVKFGGKEVTYNDLFRIVHDYFGHIAEGNGFRGQGEYNAWRNHRTLYTKAAQPAMDSETLGQNAWVNNGPHAAGNAGATQAATVYAEQKAGLLPPEVVKEATQGISSAEHKVAVHLTPQEREQLRSDTTQRLMDVFHKETPPVEEYAAAALAGKAKKGWYENSAKAITNVFGPDAPRFTALLSAMSPQSSVQGNFHNALRTFINWDKAGRPTEPKVIRSIMEESSMKGATSKSESNVLHAWVPNAVRALTHAEPENLTLSGPKVNSFMHNLRDNVNEVTNDAWMASFAKIDPRQLGGKLNQSGPGKSPTYMAMSAKVRAAAKLLTHMTGESWTPREVQETVWSWAKTAHEHADSYGPLATIPELVKDGEITDDLVKASPDFHQLFSSPEHRGFIGNSRYAANAERVAGTESTSTNTAGASQKGAAAEKALRPHLEAAAHRLESVRQETNASHESAPRLSAARAARSRQ